MDKSPDTEGSPSVSAVICTRNRPDKIGRAIGSVLANDYPALTLTVIDQSTDGRTRDIVAAIAAEDTRLHYEHMDTAGLSRAYNRGIAVTDGEILAFTDDDCQAPVGWIRAIVDAFADQPDADLLYGQVVPLESEASEDGWMTPQLRFDQPGRMAKGEGFQVFGMGADFAARRRLFDAIGVFDEVLGGGGPLKSSQDYDLAYRAYRAGRVIILRPEVIMHHDGRREVEDWPSLLVNYGFGDGAFYTKHVRCLDPYALWLLGRQAGFATARQLWARVRRGRRLELSYLKGLARGARASFDFGVDRQRRLYSDDRARPTQAAVGQVA